MADTTTVTSVGYYGWSNEISSIATYGWLDEYDPGDTTPFFIAFNAKKPAVDFSVKKPTKTFTVKKPTIKVAIT